MGMREEIGAKHWVTTESETRHVGRSGKAQELTEQTNLAFLGTETQAFANMNGGGFYAAMDFHHFLLCFMVFFCTCPPQYYDN